MLQSSHITVLLLRQSVGGQLIKSAAVRPAPWDWHFRAILTPRTQITPRSQRAAPCRRQLQGLSPFCRSHKCNPGDGPAEPSCHSPGRPLRACAAPEPHFSDTQSHGGLVCPGGLCWHHHGPEATASCWQAADGPAGRTVGHASALCTRNLG